MEDEDLLNGEYLDTLGIQDFVLSRNFGKDKGSAITPSEANIAAIAKLASKISFKSKSSKKSKQSADEDGEIECIESFDITSKPRVIIFKGDVDKKSVHSYLSSSHPRHLILLNDYLLVTEMNNIESYFKSDKCVIHQVINLDAVSLLNLESPGAFGIIAHGHSFHFVAKPESDKQIWLEELETAIFAIMAEKPFRRLGWQHKVKTNTAHAAAFLGDIEAIRKMIASSAGSMDAAIDEFDECGMHPLHWAALSGHVEVVRELLEAGCSVDVLNNGLNSPLMIAASRGYYDVFSLLMSYEPDISIKNLKDRDALWMAVLYGHKCRSLQNIIDCLQSKGVNLNAQDSTGGTALHECASRNLAWPVQLLVDAGADVNSRHGRNGLTPLQMACSNPDPDKETVRAFLDKGAHSNWRDSAGRTAIIMAICSQAKKFQQQSAAVPAPGSDVIDERQHFAEFTFPVLLEIVKKGGRYMAEDVAHFRSNSARESLNAARDQWLQLGEPEGFVEYLRSDKKVLTLAKKHWTSDSSSKSCQLCLDPFNFSNRRHHCRACGFLCCGMCSSKRLPLSLPAALASGGPGSSTKSTSSHSSSPAPSPSAKGKDNESRVCDGCYNRLMFDLAEAEKARREQEKLYKTLETSVKLPAAAAASASDSPMSASAALGFSDKKRSAATSAAGSAAATSAVLGEAMQALNERGQRIQDLADKSALLNDASSDFARMANLLLQQQKARIW